MAPVRPARPWKLAHAPVALLAAAFLLALALIVTLGRQSRDLRAEMRRIRLRQVQPHTGYWLPAATLPALDGDTVVVGSSEPGRRQMLFYFTTTCPACKSVSVRWDSISRLLEDEPTVEIIRVAIDSVDRVRAWSNSEAPSQRIVLLQDERIRRLMRANLVPFSLVVDANGRVTYGVAGTLLGAGQVDSLITAASGRKLPALEARSADDGKDAGAAALAAKSF